MWEICWQGIEKLERASGRLNRSGRARSPLHPFWLTMLLSPPPPPPPSLGHRLTGMENSAVLTSLLGQKLVATWFSTPSPRSDAGTLISELG